MTVAPKIRKMRRCTSIRVQPDFGMKMRSSSILTCLGSGCRNGSFSPLSRNCGKPARPLKKFLTALCRSKITCCGEFAGISFRNSNWRFQLQKFVDLVESRQLTWFAVFTPKLLLVEAEIVDQPAASDGPQKELFLLRVGIDPKFIGLVYKHFFSMEGCLQDTRVGMRKRSEPGPGPEGPRFTARKRMSKGNSKELCLACIGKLAPNLRILPYDGIDLAQAVDRDFDHCLEILNTPRKIQ